MITSKQNELNEYWESVFEEKNNVFQQQKMSEIIKRLKEDKFINEHEVYINNDLPIKAIYK
jgi:hypothetical protein